MAPIHILMYSNDYNGLGYTTRSLTIASHLAKNLPDVSILLLTDLPIIGRLRIPRNVDYVHLPEIVFYKKKGLENSEINLELQSILKIRKKITKTAIKTFKPQLIIIEHDPLVLPGEMKHTFSFVRKKMSNTKVVWGFPDIFGEPDEVVKKWAREKVYKVLNKICDEIWIHGDPRVFDQVQEYRFPEEIAQKTFYTGYLQAPHAIHASVEPVEHEHPRVQSPYVLVTAGSGSEGYALIDNYLLFLERLERPLPFWSVIVSGPLMKQDEKKILKKRAHQLPNVVFHRFSKHILQYLKHADLVVGTGGFNMLYEIMSYQKKALFVPSFDSLKENYLRSQIYHQRGLVDLILPEELSPEVLGQKVVDILSRNISGESIEYSDISRDGLENILQRVKFLIQSRGETEPYPVVVNRN